MNIMEILLLIGVLVLTALSVALTQVGVHAFKLKRLVSTAQRNLDIFEQALDKGMSGLILDPIDDITARSVEAARTANVRVKRVWVFPFLVELEQPDNLSQLWERYSALHRRYISTFVQGES
jgi:hypothetical protein